MKSDELINRLVRQRVIEFAQRPTIHLDFLDEKLEELSFGKDHPDLDIETKRA